MSVLRPKPVSATRFLWSPETRVYSIDMSELGGFGRVYDDACDEGLTLVDRYGIREIVCVVEDHILDREREIQGWVLKPVRPYKGPPFTIKVFND